MSRDRPRCPHCALCLTAGSAFRKVLRLRSQRGASWGTCEAEGMTLTGAECEVSRFPGNLCNRSKGRPTTCTVFCPRDCLHTLILEAGRLSSFPPKPTANCQQRAEGAIYIQGQ